MRTKILAWLSTLLLLAGLLIPSAALAAGGDPLTAAAEVLTSLVTPPPPEPGALTFSTTSSSASGLVSADNLAPGDEHTATYAFTYTGTWSATVSINTTLEGDLLTCDGPGKFSFTLTDSDGKSYAPNQTGQLVKVLNPGQTVTFLATMALDLSAGNDCQGASASFFIQPTAVVHTPPPLPPTIPPQPVTGSITVRVMDTSAEGALPTPIPNAQVELSSGQTGTTNASGELTFASLPAGTYQMTVRALDPNNPESSTLQVAAAEAIITAEEQDPFINVQFRWDPPLAPPTLPTKGSVSVIVLDGSARNGDTPRPIAGAEVTLGPGRLGWTDMQGKVFFSEVPFGTYDIVASSLDPLHPNQLALRAVTRTSATLDLDNPDTKITLILAWAPAVTPPGPTEEPPAPPVTPSTSSPATGQIQGRICSPKYPGAELSAIGPDGQTAAAFIAADGVLGKWRNYSLTDLTPGAWRLTLTDHAGKAVSQNLTVTAGGTVQAADFTLACTGDGSPVGTNLPMWPFMTGILLIMGGLLIRQTTREA